MDSLEERLQNVLSDPAQMAQIMTLAQSLGAAPPAQGAAEQPPAEQPSALPQNPMLQLLGTAGPGSGRETRLFEALRPIVSERGRSRVDRAIRAARLSRLAMLAIRNASGARNV